MKRTMWMLSFSLAAVMLAAGQVTTLQCAEGCYGPRAVYSPFHKNGENEHPSSSEMLSLAYGIQDTVEADTTAVADSMGVGKPVIEEIKKPGGAFFRSALIPGWGQLYAGAKTRGLILMGIEAGAVTWAILSHLSGTDKEDKYKDYADEHWYENKYGEWYGAWEEWYDYPNYALDPLDQHLTHSLPDEKDHDYYEMIGKYDQFVYGWDDVNGVDTTGLNLDPGDPTLAPRDTIIVFGEGLLDTVRFDPYIGNVSSPRRDTYMDMRHEANQAFKRAKTMVGIILFNHVISAVDAARSARNYNVKHAELKTTLRMRLKDYEGRQIPQLVLTHRFY